MSESELKQRNKELEKEVAYWKDRYCVLVEKVIEHQRQRGGPYIVDNQASVAG
jgi:tryptophan 2,3-dioxygenase